MYRLRCPQRLPAKFILVLAISREAEKEALDTTFFEHVLATQAVQSRAVDGGSQEEASGAKAPSWWIGRSGEDKPLVPKQLVCGDEQPKGFVSSFPP